ncbi:MAG TPA: TonB-dependent receptor [Gemmatimonadaceae bacterium]|jgi:TonB-dependent SusC/RagA subfamily outer membrane receptor|nr:TonB-dependent receptor [Gemmatimonadaceae bacterium]
MRSTVRSLLSLLVIASPALARAQVTITGRVLDNSNNGLAGAQILIENTTIGTIAGDGGGYRLVVGAPRAGMVVLVRALGYKPARQPLSQLTGSMTADFRLTPDVLRLGEVVVTSSRGETERSKLGATVATVNGDDIAKANTVQLDAALSGKVSGALVQQMSGQPGGGTSVRIRGLSTISRSAEPLYIVDGVIVDNSSPALIDIGGYSSNRLADLDPNEIDHIEIVKGAAAAALYGSRANDGVVQIFTKRGHSGTLRTSFRTTFESDEIEHKLAVNEAPVKEDGSAVTRYDYQDVLFQKAPRFSNTLSLSGGDDKTTFFLSGTAEQQKGILRSTDYRRQNLRLNLDRTLNDRLKIGVSTAYITSKANVAPNAGLQNSFGLLTSFFFMPNYVNLNRDPVTGVFPSGPPLGLANPLDIIANWKTPQNIDRFIGGLNFTAFPISGMTASYRFGFDGYTETAQVFVPRVNTAAQFPTGISTSSTDRSRLVNSDLDLSYIMNVGILKLTHGVGMNWQRQQVDVVTASARDLALFTETVQGAQPTASEGRDERRTLGFYGQEQIGVSDRLFLTGSLRSDASSAFGSEVRQQWFPKVGASINVSDYDFWRGSSLARIANTLRLRGAYGFSGGQPAGSFDRLANYVFKANGTRSGVINSTQAGNDSLKPERAREYELGTDLEVLGGRAGVELTYFNKRVTDLILPKSIDPSTGFLSQLANIGVLENHGIEGLLKISVLRGSTFTWNMSGTYATNNPLVTKVSTGGAFFIPESFSIIRVDSGEAPGHFFGATYVRDANGNILDKDNKPIKDASGKIVGIPLVGPKKIIGNPNPKAYWSFSNEFGAGKSLSLRAQFDGVQGGELFNFDRRLLETPAFGGGAAYADELTGVVPKGYFQARRTIFEEYIEHQTWVKLREVALTWSLPTGMLGRLGTHGAALTLSGRNLKTWTDFTGWDPETNAGAQRTLVRGFAFATPPIPRSYALTFSTNF